MWILFVICGLHLSLLYCLLCSMQAFDYLLGNGELLVLLYVMFPCVFVSFPYGVWGKVW